MDARLIPSVLPVAEKVIKLQRFKDELDRAENCGEENSKIDRYKQRLRENIERLEKELGYGTKQTS